MRSSHEKLLRRSVTHLLAPAPFGGLESVVELLARGQMEAGHDVTVAAVFSDEPRRHPFWEAIRDSGVRAVPLVLPGRSYLAERRGVRRILSEAGSQILHTHGYRPDVLDAPVARGMGLGTVTTVHGFMGGGLKNRAFEWVQRRAFRVFDAVVAVSEKLRADLVRAGVPAGRVLTLPNAYESRSDPLGRQEARSELGIEAGIPTFGWVGRLSPEKAPDVMLRAFARLPTEAARLSFVGEGALRGSLEAEALRLNVESSVYWHGTVQRASRLLRAFDAVVLTSWTEGTPIVLLEAMAAGVPIISTRVGGIPDVVSAEEAFLVEAGDVEGIASALRTVLSGSASVDLRAAAARARLKRDFAVGAWVQRYGEIYASASPW